MRTSTMRTSTACEILLRALRRFKYDATTRIEGRHLYMRVASLASGKGWSLYNTVAEVSDGSTGIHRHFMENRKRNEAEFVCLLGGIRKIRHETGDSSLVEYLYQMKVDDVISVFKANDETHRAEYRYWVEQIKLWLRKDPQSMRRWYA